MPIDWNAVGDQANAPSGVNWDAVQAVPEEKPIPKKQTVQSIPPKPSFWDELAPRLGNLAAGAVKGASNIGATALMPVDWMAKETGLQSQYPSLFPENRREAVTQGLESMGASPESLPFKTGEIGTEIAGTMGAGGLLGKGAEALGAAPKIVNALKSGGMSLGDTGGGALGNLATRMGAGGLTGGLQAGMINPSQATTGAGLGAALPPIVKGAGVAGSELYNIMRPIVNPKSVASTSLQGILGDRLPDVMQRLQGQNQLIPGSIPTSAQAAGTPELVALEKMMANNPIYKPLFDARNAANNAARWQAINSVAGEPGALDTAVNARNTTAKDLYNKAFSAYDPENVTPWVKGQITQLMGRPAMQSAIKQAQILAQNEGLKLTDENSIQGLHYAKMALDDQISNAVRTGDNNLVRTLSGTKDKLLTVMNKLSPGYEQAMDTYANMSRPINTMEAGQSIQQALGNGPLDSEGLPIINLGNYKTQYAKAIKSANYGISPDAANTLQSVGQDLQRASISNSIRQPGSDTMYNLQAPGWLANNLYGNNFSGPTGIGKIIATLLGTAIPGHPIAGAAGGYELASRLGKFAGNRVNQQIVNGLLNPKEMSYLLTQKAAQPSIHGLLSNNTQSVLRTLPIAISATQ